MTRRTRTVPADTPETVNPLPIVGIGCSAGGLEALQSFLAHVPQQVGLAFVIIQHLDPDHASGLPDLLQRSTSMPVVQASQGTVVQADHVYVIPPGKDLEVAQGVLQVLEPTERRGMRLAVDHFLRSLALERRERAIGVILSGMGSDGVLGIRAIKEHSGLTLAQEPTDAKASGMPASAIATGLIDIVAPAAQLAARIAEYLRHVPSVARPAGAASSESASLDAIILQLRGRSGADFSLYKHSTLLRRIERRIALHQLTDMGAYVTFLRSNPQELDRLFEELLIGVTCFFRDRDTWQILRTQILPQLIANRAASQVLRAWVPACSSGEEAYSLAIAFREALDATPVAGRLNLLIYATDLDPDAIARARKGYFPANIAADVGDERLARFFVAEDDGYRIAKEIRDMVVFAPHNILSDPPFTRLDLLSCRNLLIYFQAELQRSLLPMFNYALNRDGILVLGSAESVGTQGHLFAVIDPRTRIFRRLEQTATLPRYSLPAHPGTEPDGQPPSVPPERGDNLGQLADQLLQRHYAPAAALVNADGDILYISGRTGKYLEPAAGKVNVNIHAMAREGLREGLVGVLQRAQSSGQPVRVDRLRVGSEGGTQLVDVVVHPIDAPESMRGKLLVVFRDVARVPVRRRRPAGAIAPPQQALQLELDQTREALRLTHEQMQSSLEELKSANEELQSTNEELQSTNEEVTTSKEEMQSLNEELQTVNAELQSKVVDLTWERNDMLNLLNSTEIATVFLDRDMKLRRFTAHATRLFKLIPGDIGRPLSDLVSDLDYPRMKEDALDVLHSLVFCERQVATHDGRWFRVRTMAYRTQDNVIDGVVSTFIDISETKRLEAELRARGARPGDGNDR